jgi:hypothetical protein
MTDIPTTLAWRDTGKSAAHDCGPFELARTNDTTRRFARVRDGRMEVATV